MMASHAPYHACRLRYGPQSRDGFLVGRLSILVVLLWCSTAMAAFGRAKTVTQPSAPIETLIMDTRVPFFENGHWRFLSQEEHELKKRQLQEPRASSTTSSIAAPNSTATSASTLATSSSVVASTTVSTPDTPISTTPVKPLPSPFDVGLAANFTGNNAACPTFINNFLTDPTFISCYPVSMLLQVRACRRTRRLAHDRNLGSPALTHMLPYSRPSPSLTP